MPIIREVPAKVKVWGIEVSSFKNLQGLCRGSINKSKE